MSSNVFNYEAVFPARWDMASPGGYWGFQATGMIEGFFWVGKFGKYFLGRLI